MIYLDYNATTPVAPEVIEAMLPALRDLWGNPSSSHAIGLRARAALDEARARVASLVGCRADEVVFTSGGTESDNTAILGVAEALKERGRHLVVSAVEHAAVEQACRVLEERGFSVTRVPVDADGRVSADAVEAELTPATVLVSIMHAQNETGVLQPVTEIGRRTRARGIAFHTDAAQSVGKLRVKLDELGADLLTIAGHKLYAPKGVGALIVRRGLPFSPLLRGAGHEAGRRAGTEAVPAIVGLGAACALAERELPEREHHLRVLRDRLESGLRRVFPALRIHGERVARLPNTASVAIPGIAAHAIATRVEGVALAAGAACHSGRPHVSTVLEAMGVEPAVALSTLRLTVGRPTTVDEIDRAVESLGAAAREAT